MIDVIMLILAIISIPLYIWLGSMYYNWVINNYNKSSDIVQACIFGGLFMAIVISLLAICGSISNIIGGFII